MNRYIKRITDKTDKMGVAWFATELEVSRQTVYSWLAGELPSVANLQKLADFFGVPVEIEPKIKINLAGQCGPQGVADGAPTESGPQDDRSEDLDPKFSKTINDHFWDLV